MASHSSGRYGLACDWWSSMGPNRLEMFPQLDAEEIKRLTSRSFLFCQWLQRSQQNGLTWV